MLEDYRFSEDMEYTSHRLVVRSKDNVEKLTPSVWKNRRTLLVTGKKLCNS